MKKIVLLLPFLLIGCGTTTHYTTFEAKPTPGTYTYYSNGIPITSYTNGKESVLFSTEETSIFGDNYLRVWILLRNDGDSVYLLEPYNIINIIGLYTYDLENSNGRVIIDTSIYLPESPSQILDKIEAQENSSLILTAIGGALKAIGTKGTTIKDNNGNIYKVNDKEEKQDRIIDRTKEDINNTANWYSTFEDSFNSGVLRKNTLFPHKSINGYIYFQLGNIFGHGFSFKDYNFKIIFNLNNIKKVVDISPVNVW
ncbi:MAG: hypothetical protein P4L45_13135 [Ignavibacteriaceae bacterium]|jgi:hypothetical protein|nr:hypothetical protein [Ignavibacteriaceae bacterium]